MSKLHAATSGLTWGDRKFPWMPSAGSPASYAKIFGGRSLGASRISLGASGYHGHKKKIYCNMYDYLL